MNARRALAFCLVAAFAVASCNGDSPTDSGQPSLPAQVELNPETVEVHAIGALVEIAATVLDSEGELLPDVDLDWSTDDLDVLDSQGEGVFLTVGEGTAEVTATVASGPANGDTALPSAVALVTVEQRAAELDMVPGALTLWAVGQVATLEVDARDAEGTPMEVEGDDVSWSVDEEAPVAVDAEGRVTALEDGSAQVSAALGDAQDEAAVAVEATFSFSACVEVAGEGEGCAAVSITARSGEGE